MNAWGMILRMAGWNIECNLEIPAKCVICVAPHTSNWDFLLGLSAYRSMGRKANFLMKKFWFFFPLKYLLHYFGGIPVDRRKGPSGGKGTGLVQSVVRLLDCSSYLNLAVTPEGTRSGNGKWKTGFLAIAHDAGVPVLLAGIDYKDKRIVLDKLLYPGPDIVADLNAVKEYYADKKDWARYPDKFQINS